MTLQETTSASYDPMLFGVELPLRGRFYPLGFALDIETNHPEVLACAGESWGGLPSLFDEPPIRVRLAVSPGEAGAALPIPSFRGMAHLFAIVGDANNYAVCDYTRAFAYGWATEPLVTGHAWFRWYFLEAIAYYLLTQLYVTQVHAACVARNGRGLLLCGTSGMGKSTLAFACARRGWTYVCDDAAIFVQKREGRTAFGQPQRIRFRESAPSVLPELDGRMVGNGINGKPTIEIPTVELPGFDTGPQAEVTELVFLERDGRREAALVPLQPTAALDRLLQDSPLYDAPTTDRQRRCLAHLSQAPSFELRYGDLHSAVAALNSLTDR